MAQTDILLFVFVLTGFSAIFFILYANFTSDELDMFYDFELETFLAIKDFTKTHANK